MKKITFFLITGLMSCQLIMARIYLWEKNNMPNSRGLALKDSIANDRQFVVANPSMEVYCPSKEENRKFAVLVIPGGGYAREAFDVSGTQIARFINSLGGTAFVLRYRLPVSPDLIRRETAALQDAQRAMQLIHSLAGKYQFNSRQAGVFGTSAGGHLAALLGVSTDDVTGIKDSVSNFSHTPDFMILLSPVITMTGPYIHQGSRDNLLGKVPSQQLADQYSCQLHISAQTPATLLLHANDDKSVPSMNSVMFYSALREKNVNASLHIFPTGGHAINLTKTSGTTRLWTTIVDGWLNETGVYN